MEPVLQQLQESWEEYLMIDDKSYFDSDAAIRRHYRNCSQYITLYEIPGTPIDKSLRIIAAEPSRVLTFPCGDLVVGFRTTSSMSIDIHFCRESFCKFDMPSGGVNSVLHGKYPFHKDIMFGNSWQVVLDHADDVCHLNFICAFIPDSYRAQATYCCYASERSPKLFDVLLPGWSLPEVLPEPLLKEAIARGKHQFCILRTLRSSSPMLKASNKSLSWTGVHKELEERAWAPHRFRAWCLEYDFSTCL